MTPSALNNEDVVREILEYLVPDHETGWANVGNSAIQASKSWLYRIAFVSRTFSQPALDLLWRVMESVDPLLFLLPENVLQRGRDGYSVLYDPSISPDISRFLLYASKVKTFHYNAPSRVATDLYGGWYTLFSFVQHPVIPSPLLPQLSTLYIGALALSTNPSVPFFLLSPTLRRINFASLNGIPQCLLRTFVSCMLCTARELQHFNVRDELPGDITNMLFHFPQLRSLRLAGTDWTTLHSRPGLARLSNLVSLSIDLSALLTAPAVDKVPVCCPNLKRLTINCRITVLVTFVNGFFLPALRELDLNLIQESGSFGQPPLNALSGDDISILGLMRRWSSSLEKLKISGGNIIRIDEIARSGNGQPYFIEFKQLKFFEIRNLRFSSFLSPLSEYTCWALARCFPNLQHLSLPLSHSVSFTCLRRLALICPRLRFLQIGIDALSFSQGADQPFHAFSHNLQELSVGETIVHDPFLLARPLLRLFPNLKSIHSPSKVWACVSELFAFYHSLRLDPMQHHTVTPKGLQVLREKMIKNVHDFSLPEDLRLSPIQPQPIPAFMSTQHV